jgi:hypothetical protein
VGPLIVCREYLKEASRCTIQTTFDVSFDEPLGSFPCLMDIDKGRVASLVRSESVAVSRELWFVIGFQNGAYDVLYHFWRPVWHAEWSFSAFGFVYIDSP